MKLLPPPCLLRSLCHKFTVVEPKGGYRPDVDGLRALAVLAVVAFHYFPGKLPGGFVGVDVFFVISGYLITGILAKSLTNHNFSLLYFYERRVRRIFPGLILILTLCLVVGWLTLFPSEYAELGQHIAAGAGYIQNFALWAQSGYFDTEAIEKPLLHLWSLAVEEQFYILWPLVLWVILRRRWPALAAISLIAGVSFALNIWAVHQGQTAKAFYWPTTRAWELMVGAWLAMAHFQKTRWISRLPLVQSTLGLALILLGIGVIRPEHFPGFWALLPTIGTALVINAGPATITNRKLLSLKPVVWVGLISYPLYLWHWSLWSLVSIVHGGMDAWEARVVKVLLALASVGLAWLTYRYFEQPVRRRGSKRVPQALFLTVIILGAAGLCVWLKQGVPDRPLTPVNMSAEGYLATAVRSSKQDECYNLNKGGPTLPDQWYCVLGDAEADTWIGVLGDSHSLSMIPALNHYGQENNVKVIYAGISGCLPLLDLAVVSRGRSTPACTALGDKMMQRVINKKASAVVYVQRWSQNVPGAQIRPKEVRMLELISSPNVKKTQAFKQALRTTLDAYNKASVPVVLLKDNPQQIKRLTQALPRFGKYKYLDESFINKSSVNLKEHIADQATVNKILESIAAKYPKVTTPNINKALCWNGICPWAVDGKMLYYNDDHLSITGAMKVYPILEKAINQALGRY